MSCWIAALPCGAGGSTGRAKGLLRSPAAPCAASPTWLIGPPCAPAPLLHSQGINTTTAGLAWEWMEDWLNVKEGKSGNAVPKQVC